VFAQQDSIPGCTIAVPDHQVCTQADQPITRGICIGDCTSISDVGCGCCCSTRRDGITVQGWTMVADVPAFAAETAAGSVPCGCKVGIGGSTMDVSDKVADLSATFFNYRMDEPL